jgi:beta-xylosidase
MRETSGSMAKAVLLLIFALTMMTPTTTQGPTQRLDINGQQVNAHDGELLYWNDEYVWIGTDYGQAGSSCYFSLGSPTSQFCGFVAYTSSTPTGPWYLQGPLFDPGSWQARCGAPNFGCFRPHEAFSGATGKWVLWANVSDRATIPGDSGVQAWTADSPLGPFTAAGQPILHGNFGPQYDGDLDIWVDDDGTGYAAYTSIGVGVMAIMVEQLTPDLLDGAGNLLASVGRPAYVGPPGDGIDEAPSLFKRNGIYYLTFSDPACPYCSGTGTSYDMARSPLGPWTAEGSLSSNSCGGQPAAVSELPGGYIYQSDLWLETPNESAANQHWESLNFNANGTIQPLTCTEWNG